MSEQKQQQTCTICLEDITIEKEVRIDCCNHRYCKDCIKYWVETQQNSCPQCKQKVNLIIEKDVLGRDMPIPVVDKEFSDDEESSLLSEEHLDIYCSKCHQKVEEEDLESGEAELCDRCVWSGADNFQAIHLRCMDRNQQGN